MNAFPKLTLLLLSLLLLFIAKHQFLFFQPMQFMLFLFERLLFPFFMLAVYQLVLDQLTLVYQSKVSENLINPHRFNCVLLS